MTDTQSSIAACISQNIYIANADEGAANQSLHWQ